MLGKLCYKQFFAGKLLQRSFSLRLFSLGILLPSLPALLYIHRAFSGSVERTLIPSHFGIWEILRTFRLKLSALVAGLGVPLGSAFSAFGAILNVTLFFVKSFGDWIIFVWLFLAATKSSCLPYFAFSLARREFSFGSITKPFTLNAFLRSASTKLSWSGVVESGTAKFSSLLKVFLGLNCSNASAGSSSFLSMFVSSLTTFSMSESFELSSWIRNVSFYWINAYWNIISYNI